MAEDIRNGLTTAGEPGYANYDLIDTTPRWITISRPHAVTWCRHVAPHPVQLM